MTVALSKQDKSFLRAVYESNYEKVQEHIKSGAKISVINLTKLIYSTEFLDIEYRILTVLFRDSLSISNALTLVNTPPPGLANVYLKEWESHIPYLKQRVTNVQALLADESPGSKQSRTLALTTHLVCMPTVLITIISEYEYVARWEDSVEKNVPHSMYEIRDLLCCTYFQDKETGGVRQVFPYADDSTKQIMCSIADYYAT